MDNRETIKISIKEDDENLRFSGLRILTLSITKMISYLSTNISTNNKFDLVNF